MSLFGSIGNIFSGVAKGYSSGGFWGGVAGGVSGLFQKGPKNPNKTKNIGMDPTRNLTKGTYQATPYSSPMPMSSAPPGSVFSASPTVRAAAPYQGTYQTIAAMPGSGLVRPADTFMGFGAGAGATGTFPTTAPGSMMSMYRRYYTKSGAPRRTRKDGQPYAVPHMNPMNVRAARRAVRRIRGARKLLQRIERSLPRATTRRAPRRAA